MKDLLDKISSYNIFNNLLPGIVFIVLLKEVTNYDLLQKDPITGIFIYYFVGLIISRVGSLIVEPLLIKIKVIKFQPYSEYLSASKNYPKIEIHSETNNMYRTITAIFFVLILSILYEWIESKIEFIEHIGKYLLVILLLFVFTLSYRKQTSYITKQVEKFK